MLHITIVNSHILYKESRKLTQPSDHLFSLLSFQEALISELGFPNLTKLPASVLLESTSIRHKSLEKYVSSVVRCTGYHEPITYKREIGKTDKRGKCIWCGKTYINTKCAVCEVPLCSKTNDTVGDSCFLQFHVMPYASP